jgi:hypothetical protein
MDANWLASRTKSVLYQTTVIIGETETTVQVIELTYGPLHVLITTEKPMEDVHIHPFMYVDKERLSYGKTVCEIIEDTPAIRALITELVSTEPVKTYTTEPSAHKARIIKSLTNFWC